MELAKTRGRLVFALKLIVTLFALGILVHVIRSAEWDRVSEILRRSGASILFIALPYLFAISIDTLGWQVLLGSLRRQVAFRHLLGLRFATEAVLLSMPMGPVAAESLKAYLLQKRCGVPTPEGVSSIAAKKNLLMLSLAAFLVTSVYFGYPYLADSSYSIIGVAGLPWVILAGATALVFASFLMSVLLQHGAMAERVHRMLVAIPIPRVRDWLLRRDERFREVDASFAPLARDRRRLVSAGILFYFGFLVEAIESYVILRLIGADISFVQVLAFDASVTLIRSAAVFVPAGLGFQDIGYLAFLHAFGIPDGPARSTSSSGPRRCSGSCLATRCSSRCGGCGRRRWPPPASRGSCSFAGRATRPPRCTPSPRSSTARSTPGSRPSTWTGCSG